MAPVPGLRMFNRTNTAAKVSLSVAAGDELVVSENVANQLVASGSFEEVGAAKRVAPIPEDSTPGVVEEAGGPSARSKSGRRG